MKTPHVFFALSIFLLAASCASSPNVEEQPFVELRFGEVRERILAAGEKNWYSVQTTENVYIIVETAGSTDTYIEAYDSEFNLLAADDNGGTVPNARITILGEPDKIYYFAVSGSSGTEAGAYGIWASHEPVSDFIRQDEKTDV